MTGYWSHSVRSFRNYKGNTVTNLEAKVTMEVGIIGGVEQYSGW
jgi:hypothetical protein